MMFLLFLSIVSNPSPPASSLFLEKFHPSFHGCTLTAEDFGLCYRVFFLLAGKRGSHGRPFSFLFFFFEYANTCSCAVDTPWLSLRPTTPLSAFGQVIFLHFEGVKCEAVAPRDDGLVFFFNLVCEFFVRPFNSHEKKTLVQKNPQKRSSLCSANSLWEEPRVAKRWLPSLVPPHP